HLQMIGVKSITTAARVRNSGPAENLEVVLPNWAAVNPLVTNDVSISPWTMYAHHLYCHCLTSASGRADIEAGISVNRQSGSKPSPEKRSVPAPKPASRAGGSRNMYVPDTCSTFTSRRSGPAGSSLKRTLSPLPSLPTLTATSRLGPSDLGRQE